MIEEGAPAPQTPADPTGPGGGRLLYFQTGSEMKSGAGLEAGTEGDMRTPWVG